MLQLDGHVIQHITVVKCQFDSPVHLPHFIFIFVKFNSSCCVSLKKTDYNLHLNGM